MTPKVRIYLNQKLDLNLNLVLDKQDTHYLKTVMRLKSEDNILLFNSLDGEFLCSILKFVKHQTHIKIMSKTKNNIQKNKISLIFSIIKTSKLDFLIQKCTEIGVKEFIPIISDKSVIRDINSKRIEKIIKESCEQSNQLFLPKLSSIEKFEKKIKSLEDNAIIFFADINSSDKKIDNKILRKDQITYLLIGPEGDWSLKEREILKNMKNCVPFSLSENILRSETAAIVGLALLKFQIN